MEEPFDRALRLLAALEELAGQEAVLLRSASAAEAVQAAEIVGRAEPLVQALGELAGDDRVRGLSPRIAALMARRRENAAVLESHLARLRSNLRSLDESRGRLARIAPVYGGGPEVPPESRLNTAA